MSAKKVLLTTSEFEDLSFVINHSRLEIKKKQNKMSAMKILLSVGLIAVANAQSWEGNYYRLRMEKESPIWTIHGLWPEWSTGFCKNVTFNEALVADLVPQLNRYWPSDQGSNPIFWAHE